MSRFQLHSLLRGVRHRRRAARRRQERLARRDVPEAVRAGRPRPARVRHHRRGLPTTCWTGPAPGTRCTPSSTISTRTTSPRWRAKANARVRSSTAPGFPTTWPPRSWPPTACFRTSTARRSVSLCEARRPPRTCRRPASPASRTPISTSRVAESLLDACRRCFASLFTDRAIHYRIDQGFDHFKVSLSIGVMKMVRSDLASSGVMFSIDTESGFHDVGVHHRRLRPWRERGSGRRRPRRVLRPQADLTWPATAPCCAA